jgi:hypothetical protein
MTTNREGSFGHGLRNALLLSAAIWLVIGVCLWCVVS